MFDEKIEAWNYGPVVPELYHQFKIHGAGGIPVDAAFNAIKAIIDIDPHLQLFQVHAVTQGTDAQAECTVRLEEDGRTVNGQGAHEDTVTAAARAYVAAVNKLIVKREKVVLDQAEVC